MSNEMDVLRALAFRIAEKQEELRGLLAKSRERARNARMRSDAVDEIDGTVEPAAWPIAVHRPHGLLIDAPAVRCPDPSRRSRQGS